MKLRLYPKKVVVEAILRDRLEEANEDLQEAKEALATRAASPLYSSPELIAALQRAVEAEEDNLQSVEDQLNLLSSHVPEEVATEIEL